MRLPPLPEDQWDERAEAALASLLPPGRRNPQGAGTALATFVRDPDLTESFLPFSTRLLLSSTLPPRLRELAILRIARRFRAEQLQDGQAATSPSPRTARDRAAEPIRRRAWASMTSVAYRSRSSSVAGRKSWIRFSN
jgi:alkylhydroperoxidase family enzyme